MTKPTKPPSNPLPDPVDRPYVPGDPIPAPDAVEKDTDTAWALFEDVAAKEQHRYADTAPMTKPGEVHKMPTAAAVRTTGTSLLEKVLAELTRQNRVCPVPAQWDRFFEELVKGKSSDEIASLAPPMTGDAWKTSSLAKRMTMKDQISWAERNGKTDAAYQFLVHLRESDWFHVGEPTSGG